MTLLQFELALHCHVRSTTICRSGGHPADGRVQPQNQNSRCGDMRNGLFHCVTGMAVALALSASSALAQKKYDPGATDTEIKIGQTVPFSGPASAFATIGKAQAAYFNMINEQGGVNGRKIKKVAELGWKPV
jgi:ABC-type branched-subunit amino acid transport system substrate-binding protein